MRTSKYILLAHAALSGLAGLCRAEPDEAGDLGGAGGGEALSIRDQLTAAFADPGGDPAPAAAAPSPTPAAAPAAAPAAPAGDQAQAQAGAASRDAQGRFAKTGEQGQNISEPNAALPGAEPQPSAETIRPPASWSAAAKADFAKLPPHIQQEVVKREADIETGKAQWDQKAQRFNRLDALLSPRQDRFRLAGISEEQALQQLFAAQDFLERDPVQGLLHLARSSGVSLQHLAQAMGGQQPLQQQAQLPPQLQQLVQKVQTLEQAQQQQLQSAQQQGQSAAQREIEAFAADPANLYFANVREQMGQLIRSGQASDLKSAYEAATWAHPEIRPLLIRDQTQAATAEQQRQQQQRAAQARQASGSITGSPAPGSSGPGAGPAPTLRAELERAWTA